MLLPVQGFSVLEVPFERAHWGLGFENGVLFRGLGFYTKAPFS